MQNKNHEVDAYSYWYIFCPINITLLLLSIALLAVAQSDYRPSSGVTLLLVNPVIDWVLIFIFGGGLFARLVSDFWQFRTFRYILAFVLVTATLLLSVLVVMSLPLNIVIILSALIITFAVSR